MNWITNFVKPKLNVFSKRGEIPENLWIKCDACENMIFHRMLAENLNVCTHCDHHMQFGVDAYMQLLFDDSLYQEIPIPEVPIDPLKFKDSKKYADRIKQYRHQTKRQDAVLMGAGLIGGNQSVLFVMDFAFMGGSMGMAVGASFVAGVEQAIRFNAPFIVISRSGGARMQEAVLALMQMPRTVAAIELLRSHHLPYLVVLASPTFGGVTASFAMLGDIHIAEPGALIGFTGRRVIEQTIRQKLPDDFQTAEYQQAHGMVDMIVSRKELKTTLARILGLIRK
ncbi:MAG: acetyl-CoA carboxylase, carboxyltransferase subunit beta [Pseudomonadota bacterium]